MFERGQQRAEWRCQLTGGISELDPTHLKENLDNRRRRSLVMTLSKWRRDEEEELTEG